jgi:hypothetical protein
MKYTNQQLNSELLARGATTYGSFERRMARLERFMEYEAKKMTSHQILRKIILDEQEKIIQRAKLRAAEYEAVWALMEMRNSKTESRQSVEIPTSNEACICGPNLYCMQCTPGGYSNS